MRIKITIILLAVMLGAKGQDLPDLTNYQHNWLIFNPAFAGSRDLLSMSFFSKDNAILQPGIPAPKYFQVAAHSPFKKFNKNAWGLSYFNEREPGTGLLGFNFSDPVPMLNHNLTGYFAHKVRILEGQLSFGLAAILTNERIDYSNLDPRQSQDPRFLVDIEPEWLVNFGAGALYYTNNFFAALSVPRLINPLVLAGGNQASLETIDTTGLGSVVPVTQGSFIMNYNFMLAAGNQFEINENLTVYPSFIAGYIPSAELKDMNYMVSLNVGLLQEKFWLGTIYKSANEIAINFNVELSKVLLGLSWDFPLSRTPGYFDNAFEIILRWDNLTKVVSKAPFYF